MNTRSGVMRLKSTRYFFSSYCRYYFAPRSFSSAARRVNHKYNNPVSWIKTYLSNTLLSGRNCIKPHGRWPDNTRNHYMVIRVYSSAVEGKNVVQDIVANSVEKEIVRSLDDAQNNQTEKMETQKPFVECETQKKSPAMTRLARFRDEFLTRVVPCEEITDSWDNFPYYIDESTKSLLSECVGSRLKHKELTRDYSGRLACSSGRIMLQSIPGTVLYRNRLVGALAREKQVPMMVLDSSFLPYILSEDGLDEEIASDSEDEEESDDEDDSKTSAGTCAKCGSKYGSSKSSSSSSQSKPEKTNCLLKEGDRVKYVGPTTTSTNETKRILSTGQRGEVQEINGDKVAVIFSISDLATKETDPQPSLSWLDVEHVRHDCDAKMHDCYVSMGVLCEVLKSRQPLILYFPDSFRWLPSSASKTARREFVCYTKKMFGQLTGRVVMICGEDEWEQSRNTKKYPCSLKKLFKELSATRQCKDDGASKLFTNVVYIKPPEEEGLMKTFCEKIEEDRTRVISRSNSIEMQKVLKEHGLLCTDLDHIKTDDMILTKWKAEKIIGWATNHHLSSCLSPPLAGGLLHVPHESLKIAVSRLKEQETESKKKLSTKKNVKDLAVDEFEEEIVAAVVCPDEIGVKFDDVGALEHVKKVLNELVILPMKRPELFSRGNLLRPCKGLLLFGPPGTGKTLIAKALATEAGANFINVTATSLTSMWYGDSEKNARALFSLAGKLAPAVIFVDEIDSLLGARGGPYESGANRRLKNEFMSSWDGLNSKDSQRILVIGATNRPFDLDDAVVRRMPRRIYVDLPDVETRLKILDVLLAKENLDSGFSLEQLAEATDSYSGSDLKNLCVAAAYTPVQELLQEESKGNKVDGAPSLRPLKLDDFIRSKATVVPSVSHSATSMIELRKWNEEYGEGGSRRKSPFAEQSELCTHFFTQFFTAKPHPTVSGRKGSSKLMAVPYSSCFKLPEVNSKCRLFSSTNRICTRVSSVQSLHLEPKVDPLLDSVKWDDKGLAVAIAQNVDTGAVLMQGFVNREALSKTISSRKATFYSRSRSTLWTKGETSMNFINVCDVFIDCDRDSIIYLGKPDGPTCHTGAETCYFTSVNEEVNESKVDENKVALTTLYSLESTITKRKEESSETTGKPSWTKRLLLDEKLLCSKIREEADELCRTLEENEDKSRTASEMADVLYHSMVLLARKGVKVEDVLEVLRHRFSQSGLEEKKARKS